MTHLSLQCTSSSIAQSYAQYTTLGGHDGHGGHGGHGGLGGHIGLGGRGDHDGNGVV